MFVLVLSAEADETRQTMTMLITSLIGIAVLLAVLTVWYWFFTDPKRQASSARASARSTRRRPGERSTASEGDAQDGHPIIEPVRFVAGAAPGPARSPDPEVGLGHEEVLGIDDAPRDEVLPDHEGSPDHDGSPEVTATPEADRAAAAERRSWHDDANEGRGVRGDEAVGSQTWDFVAAARRAEEEGIRIRRPERPAAPRIQVSGRSATEEDGDDGDELAMARRRREREAARGLTDEAWETVRRSVFNKLDG